MIGRHVFDALLAATASAFYHGGYGTLWTPKQTNNDIVPKSNHNKPTELHHSGADVWSDRPNLCRTEELTNFILVVNEFEIVYSIFLQI